MAKTQIIIEQLQDGKVYRTFTRTVPSGMTIDEALRRIERAFTIRRPDGTIATKVYVNGDLAS